MSSKNYERYVLQEMALQAYKTRLDRIRIDDFEIKRKCLNLKMRLVDVEDLLQSEHKINLVFNYLDGTIEQVNKELNRLLFLLDRYCQNNETAALYEFCIQYKNNIKDTNLDDVV